MKGMTTYLRKGMKAVQGIHHDPDTPVHVIISGDEEQEQPLIIPADHKLVQPVTRTANVFLSKKKLGKFLGISVLRYTFLFIISWPGPFFLLRMKDSFMRQIHLINSAPVTQKTL